VNDDGQLVRLQQTNLKTSALYKYKYKYKSQFVTRHTLQGESEAPQGESEAVI